MKCRKCKETMKELPGSFNDVFDVFSTMLSPKHMYCDTKTCEHYGFLTVAGIPEETPKEE